MNDRLFSQYVLQPTRMDNTLDLFLTNCSSLVNHVDVRPTSISDHNLVEIFLSYNPCQLNMSVPPLFEAVSFRSLDFNKADFDGIRCGIEEIYWAVFADENGLESFPESFATTRYLPGTLPPKTSS